MSRVCRNMGDSRKLRFDEVDHESKMRLLKTQSHTSNSLAMEPGKREEKQLKETRTLQQGKPPIQNLSRTAGVAGGGGQKRLYGKQTTEKALWQGRPLSKGRGTQVLIRGRITQKESRGPLAWRGLDEETTNTLNGRSHHLQPREGEECLGETCRINTT